MKVKTMFYIRHNNQPLSVGPLKNGIDDIDEALYQFNKILESGERGCGELWELVAKDPYSKIILKSEFKD